MTHFSSSTTQALSPDTEMGPALCLSIEQSCQAFQGRKVLVTGAYSLLGGHLVRALQRAGAAVTALDTESASPGFLLKATGIEKEVRMVEADHNDQRVVVDLMIHSGFSHVFHLAPTPAIDVVKASQLLPRDKWPLVIHTSGAEVRGTNAIGLRPCHVFGPYNLDFEKSVIARAMRNIFRDGESPEMSMSAMDEFHDYIYVEDAVRALLHLACFEKCRGQNYDLPGTHYGATADVLREVVSQVSELQDEAVLVEPRSALARHHWNRSIRIVPSKPNAELQSTPRGDGSGLWQDAAFEPETSFRAGLRLTAQFYAGYFSQSVLPKSRFKTATPIHLHRPEPAFETVYTDDGLPVYVLNPHAHVRDKGAPRSQEQRPQSFLLESVLTSN